MVNQERLILSRQTSTLRLESLLIENVYLMHKQPQCQHYHEPYRTHSILMDKTRGSEF